MSPILTSLIALQSLDTAADAARKRIAELPALELAVAERVEASRSALEGARARQTDNKAATKAIEKDVAVMDARLAKFDDHKAAVKTNQEYTALLHEIAAAKTEKNTLEEKQLVLMEEAEAIAAEIKSGEAGLKEATREADQARAALAAERASLDSEIARLTAERVKAAAAVPPPTMARYEQLIKQRRGIAVAAMRNEICTACHVRLRPHVTQQIRRNEDVVQCESCQRILYYPAPAATPDAGASA
jgi:predicted  nucleic acid-binding Zn-ribbon protein